MLLNARVVTNHSRIVDFVAQYLFLEQLKDVVGKRVVH